MLEELQEALNTLLQSNTANETGVDEPSGTEVQTTSYTSSISEEYYPDMLFILLDVQNEEYIREDTFRLNQSVRQCLG